ncbi:MAG: PEGA domain-containing protein [Deltaproteobacteria bacterium]|nr:PEGA domain-containing protein [Deltaproteobacteria bacterium]TLN00781.1 MAG: PEGA domain-containing protein [bacterium]
MLKKKLIVVSCGIALFGFGCQPMVLKQDIPVSSNPLGAKIIADGTLVGQTPATVSLERTKSHIITLVKENYRQEDVVISRQYQSNKVLLNAVQSGVNTGLFFKNARMALNSGVGSISGQEQTGEAYVLTPATVRVTLIPLAGRAAADSETGGYPDESSAADTQNQPDDQDISTTDVLKAGIEAGAAGLSEAKPLQKNWQTSSSSSSYVQPDGTQVTKKSSTSVGVSVNPAGILKSLDTLFN